MAGKTLHQAPQSTDVGSGSATQILSADPTRKSVTITNQGPEILALGKTAVTFATGLPLDANATCVLTGFTGALYARASAGLPAVLVVTEREV